MLKKYPTVNSRICINLVYSPIMQIDEMTSTQELCMKKNLHQFNLFYK